MASVPPYPPGLGKAGRRLWRQVHARYELESHEDAILAHACVAEDQLDDLARRLPDAGKEYREWCIVQARLLVACRLPTEDAGDRTQRRGIRGVYGAAG